jgi:hypothetical protein
VSAQGEEVVLPPHPGEIEDRGEDLCQEGFSGGPRPASAVRGDGFRRGRGESLAVDLAAGREGQGWEDHEGGRLHCRG